MAGERAHLSVLPFRQLTPVWKKRVDDELLLRRRPRIWLAKNIGVTPGAVTHMLRADTKASRLVEPTCELLVIPPPEFLDDFELRLMERVRFLHSRDPARALRLYTYAEKLELELRVGEPSQKEFHSNGANRKNL